MHSYASVVESGHEELVYQAGLKGYFDHVFTLYPTIGSDLGQPSDDFPGSSRFISMNTSNTFIEYKMAFIDKLQPYPMLNFIVSQMQMLDEISEFLTNHEVSAIRGNCPFLTGLYSLILSRELSIPYSLRIGANYDLLYQNTGEIVYKKIFRKYEIAKACAHLVLRNADSVCAVNQNNLTYALNNGAKPGNSTIIRYGNVIDNAHYSLPSERQSIIDSLDIPGRRLALFVGRLMKPKHLVDVLEATKIAAEIHPDLLTIFVGNGDYEIELKQKAEEMNVLDHVLFLGKRDQEFLARLYPDADVFLSPVTGRSLSEAALGGLPIIAYDYEWQSEFVIDRKTGRLIEYRDSKSMGEALNWLLDNPDEAKKLGKNAREHALEMMDKEAILNRERNEYTRILQS